MAQDEFYVTQKELGRVLGVATQTIENWVKDAKIDTLIDGKVGLKSGTKHRLNYLKEEIERLNGKVKNNESTSSKVSLQEELLKAQIRKVTAEAGLKEVELEREKNLVIEVGKIREDISNTFIIIRTNILAMPSRLAMQLSGLDDPNDVYDVLDDVCRETLENLYIELKGKNNESNESIH